jgi:hypothetical protein
VCEVLDHGPPDLTAAELVVLVALAEKMPRRVDYDYETRHLLRRTRLKPAGLRKAIARLAGRGIEVRVAIGKDRNGGPLFAVPGQSTRWRLPAFEAPDGCGCDNCQVQLSVGAPVGAPTFGGGTTGAAAGTTGAAAGTTGAAVEPTGAAADPVGPPTPSVRQDEDGGTGRGPHTFEPNPLTSGRTCRVCEAPEANRARHPRLRSARSAAA